MFGDGNMQTVSFVFTAESEVRKKKIKTKIDCATLSLFPFTREPNETIKIVY